MIRTRKKRKLTLADWGRIPVAQPKTTENYETKAEWFAREAREEQERLEAARIEADRPRRELEAEFNKNFVALAKFRASTVLTESDAELVSRCTKPEKTLYKTQEDLNAAILSAAREAFAGRTIDEGVKSKLIQTLRANPNIDPTVPANWTAVYGYLTELGVIEPDQQPQPVQPTVEPQPVQPTHQTCKRIQPFDEILNSHSVESRSGERIVKEALNQEVRKDYQSAIYKFLDEVKTLFSDDLTDDERQAVARIVNSRNLDANSVKGWHQARVSAVRARYVREKFLTPDEALAWSLDRDEISLDSFSDRQAFSRRVSELHKGIPLLS